MDFEFETTRTSLANAFAGAGAELLGYLAITDTAVAAIPDTQPQKYAVAGTLKGILSMAGKMMGEDGVTGLEGLTRYGWTEDTTLGIFDLRARADGSYVKFADVERLLAAPAAGEAVAWQSDLYKGSDAKHVMMSAFAHCPSNLPHPQKMAWIGDFFLKHYDAIPPFSAVSQSTGDLTDEAILRIAAEIGMKIRTGQGAIKFARAAIATHLARKPKAEQPMRAEVVERFMDYSKIEHLIGNIFFAGDFKAETANERELEALLVKTGHRYASWDEISAFRADDLPVEFSGAHLARQAQAEPERRSNDLHDAIMNLPCKRTMSHFATRDMMIAYKEGHRDARHAAAELALGAEVAPAGAQNALHKAVPEGCYLSWDGKNVYGDNASILAVKNALHDAGTVPELKGRICEMQQKVGAQNAEAIRNQAKALRPFAELAELFDEENRGSNMPGKDSDSIMQWPRMHKDYELTVGHLRAARSALQTGSANTQEGDDK